MSNYRDKKVIRLFTLLLSLSSYLYISPSMAGNTGAEEFRCQPYLMAEQPNRKTNTEIIVKYKRPDVSAKTSALTEANVLARISSKLGSQFIHKRILATGANLIEQKSNTKVTNMAQLLNTFRADPGVEYAEENISLHTQLTPNDSRYTDQWHYFEGVGGIRAHKAWDHVTGSNVVVAVIDTGSTTHSDLAGNTLPGYDFISSAAGARDGDSRDNNPNDEGDWFYRFVPGGRCGGGRYLLVPSSWHGSHVAGTIAAVTNNNQGVAGVAFNAMLFHARVLGTTGSGTIADIADAIVWSAGGNVPGAPVNANPAQVLNMSLGGSASCPVTLQSAISTALGLGSSIVVAAGNNGINASGFTPANCNGVLAVAATDRQGRRSIWTSTQSSNFGTTIDIAAPGTGILSSINSGTTTQTSENYGTKNGTSMATPHVAGVAALMHQAQPGITPQNVINSIRNTARGFPNGCDKAQCGPGILNAESAVIVAGGGTLPVSPLAKAVAACNIQHNQFRKNSCWRQFRDFRRRATAGFTVLGVNLSSGDFRVDYLSGPCNGATGNTCYRSISGYVDNVQRIRITYLPDNSSRTLQVTARFEGLH